MSEKQRNQLPSKANLPTPRFEKEAEIPPQVKQLYIPGVFIGYFYPHLQVRLRTGLGMPHGEVSLRNLLTQDQDHPRGQKGEDGYKPAPANKTISELLGQEPQPNEQALLDVLVNGKLRLTPSRRYLQAGGLKQEVAHALDLAEITHQEVIQRDIPDQKRQQYVEKMKSFKMHGLRNISFEKEADTMTVHMDTVGIYYPFYRYIRDPQLSEELLEFSNPTGTAIILETSDNEFILQYRKLFNGKSGNVMHGGIPGASAAGMWKQTVEKPETNARIEAHEELGLHVKEEALDAIGQAREIAQKELHLDINDIADMYVTGLSGDLAAIHAEILLFGKLNLNKATLEQRSLHARSYASDPEYDFEESFVTIPATSASVFTLLTEVKCPLPANHIAAFTAAGLAKKQEEVNRDFAYLSTTERQIMIDQWYQKLQEGITRNYREIDQLAGGRYEYGKTPATQQIPTPSFAAEMKRVFGISFNEEMANKKETLPQPTNAYLFDIDGVLTDPHTKEIAKPQILREILMRLQRNEPIGLNTGRSLAFIVQKVLVPLEQMIYDQHLDTSILYNLIAIGEKGGTWLTYDTAGEREQPHRDTHVAIPASLQAEVQELIAQKFSKTMFYDTTKQTMISIEIVDNPTAEQVVRFKQEQAELTHDLQQLLSRYGLTQTFSIDPTRIATDIEYNDGTKKVGKALGAQIFYDILSLRGIEPKKFVSFGDSPSDFAMYKQLRALNDRSTFVYVGAPEDLAGEDSTGVTFTQHHGYSVDDGTYFFLV